MKKVLVSLMSLLPVVASAFDYEKDGIYYDLAETEATVTYGTNAYADTVRIPAVLVDSLGNSYNVKAIGKRAFYSCSDLKAVIIPEGLASIGEYAFSGSRELKEIALPASLTSIADYAFYSCTGLTTIAVPEGVTSIGSKAFSSCSGLTSVTIPASVASAESDAPFADCPNIVQVNINCETIPTWFSGVTALQTVQLGENVKAIESKAFYGCSGLKAVEIPSGVKTIGSFAFAGCRSLTEITIPSNVEEIANYAFYDCSGITSVNIESEEVSKWFAGMRSLQTVKLGEGVKSVGAGAFSGCSGLKSVEFPAGVTAIGESAFDGCSSLTSVSLPTAVTTIGQKAFQNCTALTEVSLPESLKVINGYVFYGCSSLASLNVPEGVTSIGNFAFAGCRGLTQVTIPASVEQIENYAFYGSSKISVLSIDTEEVGKWFAGLTSLETLTLGENVKTIGDGAFSGCSGLTSLEIPAGVTAIGESAFEECSGLTAVNIPEGVTTIGQKAFYSCTGVTEVCLPASVTSIGSYAFNRCDNLARVTVEMPAPVDIDALTFSNRSKATLYVPNGSKAAYEAANYWSDFNEIKVVESTENMLYVADMEAAGKTVSLPIALRNAAEITGLQFDLCLAEGLAIVKDGEGESATYKVSIDSTRMAENYKLVCNDQADGSIRFIGYSASSNPFTGNDGDILNLTLNIEGLAEGEYKVQLKNIVLSDVSNNVYHAADAEATISIKVYEMGDVDGNGEININDVVCLVNNGILKKAVGTYIPSAADLDGNDKVDINDVTRLVNIILGKPEAEGDDDETPQPESRRMKANEVSSEDYIYLQDLNLKKGETVEVAVLLNSTHDVKGVQGNIRLPEGFSFATKSNGQPDAKNLSERCEDFTLACALQSDGSMTFAHFSLDGNSYATGDGPIFTFKVSSEASVAAGNYEVSLTDVVLSIDGVSYDQPDFYGSVIATGIEGMTANVAADGACYDLQGRRLSAPQKGLNIIVGSDGTGRKVLRK